MLLGIKPEHFSQRSMVMVCLEIRDNIWQLLLYLKQSHLIKITWIWQPQLQHLLLNQKDAVADNLIIISWSKCVSTYQICKFVNQWNVGTTLYLISLKYFPITQHWDGQKSNQPWITPSQPFYISSLQSQRGFRVTRPSSIGRGFPSLRRRHPYLGWRRWGRRETQHSNH